MFLCLKLVQILTVITELVYVHPLFVMYFLHQCLFFLHQMITLFMVLVHVHVALFMVLVHVPLLFFTKLLKVFLSFFLCLVLVLMKSAILLCISILKVIIPNILMSVLFFCKDYLREPYQRQNDGGSNHCNDTGPE